MILKDASVGNASRTTGHAAAALATARLREDDRGAAERAIELGLRDSIGGGVETLLEPLLMMFSEREALLGCARALEVVDDALATTVAPLGTE